MRRLFTFFVVLSLYLLHFDFWLWRRSDTVLGLPVGLLYHFSYCFAVCVVLALLIRYIWRPEPAAD